MLKFCSITLFFLHIQFGLSAQGSISGNVVDSAGAPVPFAIIALVQTSDSAVIAGTPTDENGAFLFTGIHPGNYLLKIFATGYAPQFSDSILFDSTMNVVLPPIRMDNSKVLDEVSISAIRPDIEFKNGNIVVNVGSSALAKGNSVFDLLPKLPGVSVDKNIISIEGKSGVIVMIDNRVQHLTDDQIANLLRSMSAESVERIEILKNPSSKYDAAGTSGMINIITKRNTQRGFSGSVYASSAQGFYNNSAAGISLNYKNEKISVFTALDGSDGWFLSNFRHDRNFSFSTGTTLMKSRNRWKERQTGLQFRLGADWFVSPYTTVGFKIDGGPGAYTSYGTASDSVFNYNNTGFDHLNTVNLIPNKWNFTNYNLNTEHLFDTLGTRLAFSVDYTNGWENDRSYSENHFYDAANNELQPSIFQNSNRSRLHIYSAKTDFSRTIDLASGFDCGAKISSVNISNAYQLERKDSATGDFYRDTAFSNQYNYTEQTYAAYMEYSRSWKKISGLLGLRAEETVLHGKNSQSGYELRNRYFNLFPSVSLTFQVSENHEFQLNLHRRIDRPVYDNMNPFAYFQNPFAYYQGNPFLQPDYSNSVEITHSYSGWLVNTLSYERINNLMLDYTIQDDSTKIFTQAIKNMNFQNVYTYSIFVQRDIRSWWSVVLTGNFLLTDFKGDVAGVQFHTYGSGYQAILVSTTILPKDVNLEIMGLYRGPNTYGIVRINPVWMVSAAVNKSFFHDRVSCSAGVDNIFNSMKFHTQSRFDNQNWDFYVINDSRRVKFSISYNFGTAQVNIRDTNSNEDEKDRLDL